MVNPFSLSTKKLISVGFWFDDSQVECPRDWHVHRDPISYHSSPDLVAFQRPRDSTINDVFNEYIIYMTGGCMISVIILVTPLRMMGERSLRIMVPRWCVANVTVLSSESWGG